MKWLTKKDKSIGMSMPPEKTLYGVKIVKLPVGRYLQALNTLERLPEILFRAALPEVGGMDEVIKGLLSGDTALAETLLFRLLTAVPQELCRMLSELLNIPEERLLSADSKDPLTLKELLEIILAFWDMNDLTDFFGNVRRLKMKLTAPAQTKTAGSSGGLPLDKASASAKTNS